VTDFVTFLGPSDRVAQIYHAGDVLVHPTYYDPCSRVVLEAMVSGLPCVTTRWDGASEMIVDGRNGYVLAEPRDIDGLADRIERLSDPGHRTALARAARAVADRVNMKRHAAEVLAVYEELRTAKLAKV
jgi:UDP-glucose:(heptosyl)LPS alpha-1,3-glucosyltransferase